MARVLYISYTGMLQPLGRSQVLAYLGELSQRHDIQLLSYEREADLVNSSALRETEILLRDLGIGWSWLRYHKRPPGLSTALDILTGLRTALGMTRRQPVDILHCRSYVPAVIGLLMKRWRGYRFLFDMRGFWVDERVDGGLWKRDSLWVRIARGFERRFFLAADYVVSLTRAGVDEIRKLDYLRERQPVCEVIPTCTDLDRFKPQHSDREQGGPVLGYLGSAGSWYLFDELLQGFSALLGRRPDVRLLVVNRGEHDFIRERLRECSVPPASVELVSADYEEVPRLIARMDAGVFLIKPAFSKTASAPTRLGEFLACGKPCLGNSGVGDVESVLVEEQVGVCVTDTGPESVAEAMQDLLELARQESIAERCRDAAQRHFSLIEGAARYDAIYRQLAGGGSA